MKLQHNEEGYKYFIGYQEDEIVKPLCNFLPQMSGYFKYFERGSKKGNNFLLKVIMC